MSERGQGRSQSDLRHEVRTPLHAIGGNVEILLRLETARLSPEGRRSLGEIARALRALETAVDLLLRQADRATAEAGTGGGVPRVHSP